jgi:hypothetical protein
MALFAAIGDRFISKILKQVAHDYKLDFEDMKSRYLGEPKTPEAPKVTKELEAPGAPMKAERSEKAPEAKKVSEPKKAPEAKKALEPKQVDENKPMAISKMKKSDLVAECKVRGLDSEGTVAQLKERVKEARAAPVPAPVPVEEEENEEEDTYLKDAIPILNAEYLNPYTNEGEYASDDYTIIILDNSIAVTTYQEVPSVGEYLKFIDDQTREFLFCGTVTANYCPMTGEKTGNIPDEDLEHYVMK